MDFAFFLDFHFLKRFSHLKFRDGFSFFVFVIDCRLIKIELFWFGILWFWFHLFGFRFVFGIGLLLFFLVVTLYWVLWVRFFHRRISDGFLFVDMSNVDSLDMNNLNFSEFILKFITYRLVTIELINLIFRIVFNYFSVIVKNRP